MTGKALVCQLDAHIPIEGADKIVQVDMFGETVITQNKNIEGTLGLLFDCETQLSTEYAEANNMFRHSNLNKDKSVIGYMEDNARVKPIRLKGVKCSALFMPLDSLDFIKGKKELTIGEQIDEVNGVKICKKYINRKTREAQARSKTGKARENLTPTFKEHFDTDQFERNLHYFNDGVEIGEIIITEKVHGTSGRCGLLPVKLPKPNWWTRFTHGLCDILNGLKPVKLDDVYDYDFVVGSRRVVKSIGGEENGDKQHYYDHDFWTLVAQNHFQGKLHKGETVYFEIVGNLPDGQAIMPGRSISKLKNFLSKVEYKEWKKRYGEDLYFNYGCAATHHAVYVYRITMTNEDGVSIDYSWDQLKTRCREMGESHVPELEIFHGYGHLNSFLKNRVLDTVGAINSGFSDNFPNTPLEGVCVRLELGAMTPKILKSKTYPFKVLEGIIKDSDQVDIEESN